VSRAAVQYNPFLFRSLTWTRTIIMPGTIRICRDPDDLASQAAALILESARDAIAARGRFTLALSGGSTPERTHKVLARPENAQQLDWTRVWLFMGDERFVPFDNPSSNFGMAKRTLIDHISIPPGNVFPIPTWRASPSDAAAAYAFTLSSILGPVGAPANAGPPVLDLILLGLGDDGHTASLFPGKPTITVTDQWVVASPPGVLPPSVDRVTMTFPVINAARSVAFLIAGAGKANVVRDLLEGSPDPNHYPAAAVRPSHGQLIWMLDQAAAAALSHK
jgi:6-phosphogluconolactonase